MNKKYDNTNCKFQAIPFPVILFCCSSVLSKSQDSLPVEHSSNKTDHLFLIAYAYKISNKSQAHPDIMVAIRVGVSLAAQIPSIIKEIAIVEIKDIENITFSLLIFGLRRFCVFRFTFWGFDIMFSPF
jgi:hypothetical protein